MRVLIVPKGCSTVSRRWRMALGFFAEPLLHGFEHVLMLSASDPALLGCRATTFIGQAVAVETTTSASPKRG